MSVQWRDNISLIKNVLAILLAFLLVDGSKAQDVYERGTIISVPAGKHINHSYYGIWNVYFAAEDGVLVYDHHHGRWLDPITASNGLIQYPVLLVWQNLATQDVWIITPDFVFIYDHLTDWMTREALPKDAKFSGNYELGITDTRVVVTSTREGLAESYSAVFMKSSGVFENWGADSTLAIEWNDIQWISAIAPESNVIYESLLVQSITNGSFDANNMLHLDGYPLRTASSVSAISGGRESGEAFLSTYGMGVFHQKISGGSFSSLPFGLLSPDVMSMKLIGKKLLVGGRAGLSLLEGYDAIYDEAIRDPVLDYSFISAIDSTSTGLLIAGRNGVFQKTVDTQSWNRIISKKDLASTRIYSIAAGDDGNLMVATERNAYLFHESGLIIQTLFPGGLDWPVFDIKYSNGRYYISTYFGIFIFDETNLTFVARINSSGEMLSPKVAAAVDPIYESEVQGEMLWAATHRGLIKVDLLQEKGNAYLAPHAPFKPRGLAMAGTNVWIGTDMGVFSFDSMTYAWRHFTLNDGLISNFVTDLVANEDYIWIGTNLGLTRIKWRNLY